MFVLCECFPLTSPSHSFLFRFNYVHVGGIVSLMFIEDFFIIFYAPRGVIFPGC